MKITQRGIDVVDYPDLMNDDGSLKIFFDFRVWIRRLLKMSPTKTEMSKRADLWLEEFYIKYPEQRPK